MRTDKAQKIEAIASQDETRPHINCLHLNVEDSTLVATDGHMMVVLPVVCDEKDTTGPIEIDALKEARRLAKKDKYTGDSVVEVLSTDGANVLANGATFERKDRGAYPPYKDVQPDFNNRETFTVGLNAEYLYRLCQALGGDKRNAGVELTFDPSDALNPIKVTRGNKCDGVGTLMPMRV